MNDKAITPYQDIKSAIVSDEIQRDWIMALGPVRAGGFLMSVLNVVDKDEKLKQCDPRAVLSEAMRAASLDLPLEPALGMAHLVAYKNKKKKSPNDPDYYPEFSIGYKGYIQMGLRTDQFVNLHAGPIYEGQAVQENQLTGVIEITGEKKSDNPIGYFSYFKLKNGFEHALYMTNEELIAHAAEYAPSYKYNKKYSKWTTDFPAMGKKTVLKLNLKKYAPLQLSAELEKAIAQDDNGHENAIDGQFVTTPGELAEEQTLSERTEALVAAANMTTEGGARLGDLKTDELQMVVDRPTHYGPELVAAARLLIDEEIG